MAACGSGGGSPQGEVTLSGQLLSSASSQQADPLLLAMGWYPMFAGMAPGSPVGAVITQANIEYHGSFPVDFNFKLTGTPPAAALFDLSQTGGTGHLAYGVLIAFRDMNKNGVFDANSAGQADADVIVGISVPDPSRPPPEHSYFVVYLDGKPAANDYYSAFPLQQGYNLMEIHYDFGIDPVPLKTRVTIPITNSPALNLYACQEAFQSLDYFKRSCGIDPYGGTWQAQGALFSTPSGTQAYFFVNDADGNVANASITLDGAPFAYDSVSHSYDFATAQLLGTHTVAFTVPGRASETMSLTLPEPVTVSSPSPNQSFSSGSKVPLSWAPAAGTAYYDVYFLADDGSGNWLYHTITNDTSATTPSISYVGPAHMSVKALGPLAVGSQGSFMTPMSQTTVRVTFTR
ncbi:MAG TPA: hypothetical protein VG454_15915 [Gemmatimonadales bacterium]|nr:hypothetical protein [Gemmatimonadales bacterium]